MTGSDAKLELNDKLGYHCSSNHSIKKLDEALMKYDQGLSSAESLSEGIDIFLDTSVLLQYYEISFSERNSLEDKLSKFKERVWLTDQIEKEFLKNRIRLIKRFNSHLKTNIQDNFVEIDKQMGLLKEGQILAFDKYLKAKVIKNDFKKLYESLHKLYAEVGGKLKNVFSEGNFNEKIEELKKEVDKEREKALTENKRLEREDNILKLFSSFNVTPPISDSERKFVKDKYAELKVDYERFKDSNESSQYSFPGCGEQKGKDNPESDLIIFNEIIKHMVQHKKDVVFLTQDTKKGDWMNQNGEPYLQYILEAYLNTGQIIYIFDAQKILKLSFEEIFEDKSQNNLLRHVTKDEKEMAKTQVYENQELIDLEMKIISFILSEQQTPFDSISTYRVHQAITKYENINTLEVNLAIRSLLSKGYLEIVEVETGNFNHFEAYQFTSLADEWIDKNQAKLLNFNNNQPSNKYKPSLDDLPF